MDSHRTPKKTAHTHRKIDWDLPELREGFPGLIDRVFGPGHTRTELLLQVTLPTLASLATLFIAQITDMGWSAAQLFLVVVLVFNGVGGVITNSTSSAKRWFHRGSQGPRQHLAFACLHVLHFLLIALLFANSSLTWFLGASFYLVIASLLVVYAPPYLQRPIGAAATSIGIGYSLLVLPQIEGLQWVLPIFYLKILGAHLTREEPYRPAPSARYRQDSVADEADLHHA